MLNVFKLLVVCELGNFQILSELGGFEEVLHSIRQYRHDRYYVMAEPRDFSRDINAAYKKYICMALTNHEMCSRFDDFVISITKTGGVLDF